MMMLGVSGLRALRATARRSPSAAASPIASQWRSFAHDPEAAKQKVSKVKRKSKSVKKEDGARSKDLDVVLASLDAAATQEPPISQEEKARRHEIGRNYGIGRFKQHNEIEHDLACKIQMKKHAVKMLPRDSKLKEAAMKVDSDDTDEPPLWRNLAMWTPPIKDFDPSQFIERND